MDNSKSNQEFKSGDTVQLKSGGPIMTIDSYDGKRYFRCKWFAGEYDKVYHAYFKPGALQLFVKSHKKGTVKGNF